MNLTRNFIINGEKLNERNNNALSKCQSVLAGREVKELTS